MHSLRDYRGLTLLLAILLAGNLLGCSGSGGSKATPQAVSSSANSAQAVSPSQGGLLGDLDGDGEPTVGDAIRILRIVVGLDADDECADANQNDSTDVGDAIMVLRCVVGLDDWPIGECGDPGEETTGPDGQTLVLVPGGSFMMGSEEYDEYPWEQPVHQVTLTGFWIGKCEVTNDQYATFLNEVQPANVLDWLDIDECGIEYVAGTYRSKSQLGPHPVFRVNWYGAVAYCEHYGYALPTEAQWEYAAAGPNARTYPWGDVWDEGKCCNANNQGPFDTTFPVGSFPAGASWCGALDMAGNLWEWCADWYSETYYDVSPELNPAGPAEGIDKVLRGGSWGNSSPTRWFRCANRRNLDPDYLGSYRGFRCAREL
jgi:formylglycine-generating enzyme required for sulfatase activity